MRKYTRETRRRARGSGPASLVGVAVLVWLVIGVIAGAQRNYYNDAPTNCASTATIAATIAAGPLNYVGMNPKVDNCHVNAPQPSP